MKESLKKWVEHWGIPKNVSMLVYLFHNFVFILPENITVQMILSTEMFCLD